MPVVMQHLLEGSNARRQGGKGGENGRGSTEDKKEGKHLSKKKKKNL